VSASRSVLVVDDDAGAVETLVDILEAKGHRVSSAASGEAAIDIARRTRQDAALVDIVMPGLNGVETLRALKASAPDATLILMTAFARHPLVQEGLTAGASAVLWKPLDIDRVVRLIEQSPAEPGAR